MSCRRNGVRKQVTEAKRGPLELRRKREARKRAWTSGVRKGICVLHRESNAAFSFSRVFIWRCQGRIPIEY